MRPLFVFDIKNLKVVLDGHSVDDANVDDQLEAGPISVIATVALERPLIFGHVSEALLPNSLAEVRHGQMPIKLSIVPGKKIM